MGDKAWKANEREFAKFATEWLGDKHIAFRRNDAKENSDNRERNSDVDLVHKKFAVGNTQGITAELTRQKSGLGTVYKILEQVKNISGSKLPILCILNEQWIVCYRDDFKYIFENIVKAAPPSHLTPISQRLLVLARECNIMHFNYKKVPKLIVEKFEQAERYASSKNLFPILVVREPRKQQVVVINIEAILKAYK